MIIIIQVFADIFDPVIHERHGGYQKSATHPTDLDSTKVAKIRKILVVCDNNVFYIAA